jgi:hypothetical protein
VEIGRIMVWGQPRQKDNETPISTNKPAMVMCISDPSYRRHIVQAPDKKRETLSEKLPKKQKGLAVWLKRESTCQASLRPCVKTRNHRRNKRKAQLKWR